MTVLFADFVGFTSLAEDLDPEELQMLVSGIFEDLAEEALRYDGTIEKFIGDAIFVIFGAPIAHEDDPQRALRCAIALIRSLDDSGLGIRAAIHTGEIVMGEGDVGGIGVHIAARLLAEAGERQVVVTRTVRDLATGDDLSFVPLGNANLRGVPGEWELFEASTTKGD